MTQDNQRQAILYSYLAGIIDGEGTIRITKTNHPKHPTWVPGYHPQISVGMSNREVLELFRDNFGHTVGVRKECVPNRKIMYRWATTGTKAVAKILEILYPYLIVKKEQAKLVLDYCSKKSNRQKKDSKKYRTLSTEEIRLREEFYYKVKKLNAVGAAATTNQEDTREGEVIV